MPIGQDKKPLSKRQILGGIGVVGLLLAFLLVVALAESEFSRAYLVGPGGIFAVAWVIAIIASVAVLAETLGKRK